MTESDWKSRETPRIASLKREIVAQAAHIRVLEIIQTAAGIYYVNYAQDQAANIEDCIDQKQHEAAIALRDALGIKP